MGVMHAPIILNDSKCHLVSGDGVGGEVGNDGGEVHDRSLAQGGQLVEGRGLSGGHSGWVGCHHRICCGGAGGGGSRPLGALNNDLVLL